MPILKPPNLKAAAQSSGKLLQRTKDKPELRKTFTGVNAADLLPQLFKDAFSEANPGRFGVRKGFLPTPINYANIPSRVAGQFSPGFGIRMQEYMAENPVSTSNREVILHEIGHSIYNQTPPEIKRNWQKLIKQIRSEITGPLGFTSELTTSMVTGARNADESFGEAVRLSASSKPRQDLDPRIRSFVQAVLFGGDPAEIESNLITQFVHRRK